MLGTQIGAYAEIVRSQCVKVRRLYGLQLLNDGRYVFQEVPDKSLVFLHCLALNNEMSQEVKA